MKVIVSRSRSVVNTDPQSRCYNGCHFKSELVWGQWSRLESVADPDSIQERLGFWRELNDYAVESRGESARREFEVREVD